MRLVAPGGAAVSLLLLASACLLPATETLTGSRADGGASPGDGGDAGGAGTSCAAIKAARPQTPDGVQLIDPDGPGPAAPFSAWCDMTTDEGGWMLVTPAMLGAETAATVTPVTSTDGRGGLVLRIYVNGQGCGSGPKSRHRVLFDPKVAWSRVRFSQSFAGNAGCWHVFGGLETDGLDANLEAFDTAKDVLRDAVKMGGANGDAFDGISVRCDADPANFWANASSSTRSATVILRRKDGTLPAGVSTGADCGSFAPGTTSPTYWEYRSVYVK